jgi:hypothetical protein
MSSKETLKKLINQNSSERKAQPPLFTPRKTVSLRATSSDKKCPMKIIIFLGQDNHFYLSKFSCLHHLHHPCLKSEAVLHGQRDMEVGDIDLISLLFSPHLSPLQITQIISQLKGTEFGTILPKRVYDINQKTEELLNLALGLIPDCSDAVKTIAKLGNEGVNHFYIVHEEGELFACSRGHPTKELTRLRLECPQQIKDDIQAHIDNFLLN